MSGPPGGIRARASKYALLPLRLFLGATFLYAGLDKVTDPAFLSGEGSGSTGAAAGLGARRGGDTRDDRPGAERPAQAFGIAIAAGEMAVGLGAIVGLWTRLAAFGGVLISLSLWLTVSWASDPYYYGNDLPYMMAWTPLLFAGAPTLSLDMAISRKRRRRGRHIFG